MAARKLIVVFGATVVRALLQDASFQVRAVTRNPQKPAGEELSRLGAQVVKADLSQQGEIEAALQGAYGCFFVTNFLEHFSKDVEVQQGKIAVDLAKQLGLKHFVYSGLENVNKLTGGKLKVLHFDSKGEVEEYLRDNGVPFTSVHIPVGDVPMDGMSVADLGPIVVSVLKAPKDYLGKTIGLSSDRLTIQQYSEVMSKVLGKPFRDGKMSAEVYAKLGFPGAEEFADMFRFYMMKPDRDIVLTRRLNPAVRSFEQWLSENKDAFADL
ncbi:NmrA-like family domain-containing protein 1 [Acipenser ruthenus]|uniref:NmrA-like family domain-containing protein 1 n=1 Tax=Acipenser ruthenus TaxID=7906 RepID=A0A444UN88_ACIRT|nr:NmrA-like family domain-containing protein 1 [Acipenser ruthenus]